MLNPPTGLRALIYSGDHDLCVPHTGSEAWTAAMHKSDSQECQADVDDDNTLTKCDGVTNPWQPWYNSEVPKQVGDLVHHMCGRRQEKGGGILLLHTVCLDACKHNQTQ